MEFTEELFENRDEYRTLIVRVNDEFNSYVGRDTGKWYRLMESSMKLMVSGVVTFVGVAGIIILPDKTDETAPKGYGFDWSEVEQIA